MASKENANRSTPPPTVRVTRAKAQKPCKECGRLDDKREVKATTGRPRKVSTPLPFGRVICKDCGRSYTNKQNLAEHKRTGACARAAQGAKWTRSATVERTKSSKKGPTTCADCGRSYSYRRGYTEHIRYGVCTQGKQEQIVDGMFPCVYCKETPCIVCYQENACSFKTIHGLRIHNARIHHFCKMCQKKFKTKDAYRMHFPCPSVIMPQGSSSKDMDSPDPVLKSARKRVRPELDSSSESDSESSFESSPKSESEHPEQLPKTLSRHSSTAGPDVNAIMPMSTPTAQGWKTSASSPSVWVEETMCQSSGRGGPQTQIRPFLILSPLSRTEMNVTHVPETPPSHQPHGSPNWEVSRIKGHSFNN